MSALPRGTVTLLFTDIEGSTQLLHELGSEGYAEALADHRRRMREAFAAHGGVEVDTQGDAFFVAFPDAAGALAAAGEAQRALADGPIRVRMGIHSGRPLLTAEGYVGIDVHQGARVMGAGHGGQVLVSEATRALLDATLQLRDLGNHRLKDLTEAQRLWQLGEEEFPPLKTLHRTNLPVQPTPLVGRERELEQVLDLLSGSRLVTLTGAGGSGKTRLALQAAAELVEDHPDGVWWVSLAALRDHELVEPTIAQEVGARDGLADYLRGRRTLLLLDNFEQVLEAAPTIASLLSEAPDLRVLATSRERLGIAAEQQYAVPALVPAEAVGLFTVRARQLRAGFEPDESVAKICDQVGGLPLAIELAAARTKVLRPEQILQRMDKSLELLTAGARDAPKRHQTLRATIEWSHDLLAADERQLFARLAVFVGGFDLEAAEAVCEADLDTLSALVDKSLLRQTADGRFFMLETIGEYGLERLAYSGEEGNVRRRHALFFAALAERHEPDLRTGRQLGAFGVFEREQPNIRAAIDGAIAHGNCELEARLCLGCWYFWTMRGQLHEGRQRLGAALERAPRGATTAALHEGLTVFDVLAGDTASARMHADAALELRRREGIEGAKLRALLNRGGVAQRDGKTADARSYYRECHRIAEAVGDHWFAALSLSNIAAQDLIDGKYSEAAERAREALALFEQIGESTSAAASAANLAGAELELGNRASAIGHFRLALDEASRTGVSEVAIWCLGGVAAAFRDDDPGRSAILSGAVYAACKDLGYALAGFEARRCCETTRVLEARLPNDTLQRLLAEGAAMPLEEAEGYALSALD